MSSYDIIQKIDVDQDEKCTRQSLRACPYCMQWTQRKRKGTTREELFLWVENSGWHPMNEWNTSLDKSIDSLLILTKEKAQCCIRHKNFAWVGIIIDREHSCSFKFFIYWLILQRERRGWDREREKHRPIAPSIHTSTSLLLHELGPGIEPLTLEYGDDAPTNWATQPKQCFLPSIKCCFLGIVVTAVIDLYSYGRNWSKKKVLHFQWTAVARS